MKLTAQRRRLLTLVGFVSVGDCARGLGLTDAEMRDQLRELEAITVETKNAQGKPETIRLYRVGIELRYEPAGSDAGTCEMVRLVHGGAS